VANARNFNLEDRRPRVAVVLSDLGPSVQAAEAAIRMLPPEVTLAFSPYAENLSSLIQQARTAGHEVLINVPMEAAPGARDPGPQSLQAALAPRQNLDRLESLLGRTSGVVGVNAYLGPRFATTAPALKPVLEAVNQRGLMLLDGKVAPQSLTPSLASELGLPRALADRVIDEDPARGSIEQRLTEVERIARESGTAIAIGGPLPITYERLALWLPTLQSKGLALAPITAVANRQPDR